MVTNLLFVYITCIFFALGLPVFQKMILEEGLPMIVMSIFENDSEPYVRASALSCLTLMVRIQSYWDEALSSQSLVVSNPLGSLGILYLRAYSDTSGYFLIPSAITIYRNVGKLKNSFSQF